MALWVIPDTTGTPLTLRYASHNGEPQSKTSASLIAGNVTTWTAAVAVGPYRKTLIAQRGPGARPSRVSPVSSSQPNTSARAM